MAGKSLKEKSTASSVAEALACECTAHEGRDVYRYVAVAHVEYVDDNENDDFTFEVESKEAARVGFGRYADEMYGEIYCGTLMTDQDMMASDNFGSRDDAAQALDDYLDALSSGEGKPLLVLREEEDFQETVYQRLR